MRETSNLFINQFKAIIKNSLRIVGALFMVASKISNLCYSHFINEDYCLIT